MRAVEATLLLVALLACAPREAEAVSSPGGELEIEFPGPDEASAQEAAAACAGPKVLVPGARSPGR